jgi:hypothetical protein
MGSDPVLLADLLTTNQLFTPRLAPAWFLSTYLMQHYSTGRVTLTFSCRLALTLSCSVAATAVMQFDFEL